MKAAIFKNYGPPQVLQIAEVPRPSPKKNEILVRLVATSANSGDARIRGANFPKGFAPFARLAFGIFRPRNKILGNCFSGIIEEVGSEVQNFKVGDDVCGMSGFKMGTYAQFITINPKKSVVKKPKTVSHQDVSSVLFGATAALFFIRDKAKLSNDQSILINGASGAVGVSAVQIAKVFCTKITGVTSRNNFDLVKSLGANEVIDYQKTDIFDLDKKYDFVLDTVGNIDIKRGKKLLKTNGKLLLMVAGLGQMLKINKQVVTGTASEKAKDIEFIISLLESGKLKPVIDSVYSLDQIVDAHRRVDFKKKVGSIVITV